MYILPLDDVVVVIVIPTLVVAGIPVLDVVVVVVVIPTLDVVIVVVMRMTLYT